MVIGQLKGHVTMLTTAMQQLSLVTSRTLSAFVDINVCQLVWATSTTKMYLCVHSSVLGYSVSSIHMPLNWQ